MYYQHTQFHTRQHHTNHSDFVLPQATLNSYKYSFYPRTIKDWNNLPINVIEARDLDEFTYLMLTIVIMMYVIQCTIWGYYPLGIPAVLIMTAQYIILNLKDIKLI